MRSDAKFSFAISSVLLITVFMKKIVIFVYLILLPGIYLTDLKAQDFYGRQRKGWLQQAEQSKPKLIETVKSPLRIVSLVKDSMAYQHWKTTDVEPVDSFYRKSFKKQSGTVLDFGDHLTGYLTFSIEDLGRVADAPLRIRFTFGEVPSELATPFDPYPGQLSRAWLQDEVITVSEVPSTITIPRRMAFRYLKMELLGSSVYSDFRISNLSFKATTSVKTVLVALAATTDPLIAQIDKVGLNTLKECMQTVYEDGPKRDRRLWIGDLYLESLANMYSFKNY